MPAATPAGRRLASAAALLGGMLVTGGAFLPWLSFFAGLYPLRGVLGPWGKLLAGGGSVIVVLAALGLWRPNRRLDVAAALLGCALVAFAGWLTAQLLLTFRHLQANVMVVPRVGPGLFVVLAGALLSAAATLARVTRERRPGRRSSGGPAQV